MDVAETWYDLCKADNVLSKNEKKEKGFVGLLIAFYFLWCKPRNSSVFASRFRVGVDRVRGDALWKWIRRARDLSENKIKWDPNTDRNELTDSAIMEYSTDGVDFKAWERQHPKYPVDRKACSHKMKSCAAKYLIALSVHYPKCTFIAGPYRGGKADVDICRDSGLMQKLKDSGKVCIADRGFKSKYAHEREHMATPDYMDSAELFNFKSRVRLRQETYNRLLTHFAVLSGTWNYGFEKHGDALRAVAVILQYQLDNGSLSIYDP